MVSYRVSEPCTVTVAISLREEAIKDSPWTVGIEGPDAGQCTVSGPGVEGRVVLTVQYLFGRWFHWL